MITKRCAVLLMLLACCGAGQRAMAAGPSRPNILFIFSDDHAAHAVGAYGSKINRTPHIDRLASQGMLFRNCFVTNSICGPSRAVILTGKYSHLNGFPDNRARTVFDGSQQTFPKLLREAGYQTALVGKWHLRSDPTGFDYWNILAAGGGQGTYYQPEMKSAEGTKVYPGYTTDVITDLALDWLKRRDAQKPFVLMCQHKAPHREWSPDPPHFPLYDEATVPEPPTLFDDYSGRTSAARNQQMMIARDLNETDLKLAPPPKNLTPEQRQAWEAFYGPRNEEFQRQKLSANDLVRWKYQRYIKDYLRCIAAVDDNIGRLLDYLNESGLAENTVVVYSSDQGFFLGEHGWFDKRWMYEESLRTPLVVRWPGVIRPGSVDQHIALNLDFAETFLDVAGVPRPADMQGESLVPLLKGENPEGWRTSMYYHYYEFPQPHHVEPHYGIRTQRYKLIYFYRTWEWELYDLQRDPQELHSVAADPAYADLLVDLKREIEQLQDKYQDTDPEAPPLSSAERLTLKTAEQVPLKQILRLDAPDAKVRNDFDPSLQPLAVGALCEPAAVDGVVVAQGGPGQGYALYLLDGRPRFAVRSDGELSEAVGPDKLELKRRVHLVGTLDSSGQLRLFVDGRQVAETDGELLTGKPANGLSIGFDAPPAVGSYNSPFPFAGRLSDIRVYRGTLTADQLAAWFEKGR